MNIKPTSKTSRAAVIGAGPAGLSAALLLLREGFEVALFDSHSKPGGCASYFRRKDGDGRPMTFDAGATVLNGLGADGWLEKTLKSCGVALPTYEAQKTLGLRLPNEELRFLDTTNTETWMTSLRATFPEDGERLGKYLRRASLNAQRLAKLLPKLPHLPIEALADLRLSLPLLAKAPALALPLLKGVFRSFEEELIAQNFGTRFRRFVEMSLLITLQAPPREVHPLYGHLALFFYPILGAGTVRGGMKALMDACLEGVQTHPNGRVFMWTPVRQILPSRTFGSDKFEIETMDLRRMGPFDHVLSSVPRFDLPNLAPGASRANSSDSYRDENWSAIVAYLIVRDTAEFPASAFNLHLTTTLDPEAAPEGGEVYASFSARGDEVRGPVDARAVTLSTHTHLDRWHKVNRGTPEYAILKEAAGRPLVEQLLGAYPGLEVLKVEFGTPKTFQRYTRRKDGAVGGFPLSYARVFQRSPSQRSGIPNLWQIGDTAFPGQSIYACAIGSAVCVEKILGRKI